MPDEGMRRASFSRSVRAIRRWLHDTCGGRAKVLTPLQLERYEGRAFSRGWSVDVCIDGVDIELHVLLTPEFPYGLPRIALAQPDRYIVWPHVEEQGVLCLPADVISPDLPAEMVRKGLKAACDLVAENMAKVDDGEFQQEFISYWNRSVDKARIDVRSLLDPREPSRRIAVWNGKQFYLVGEDKVQLERWLAHFEAARPKSGFSFYPGVFALLKNPPVPRSFPKSASALRQLLRTDAPEALAVLERMLPTQGPIILALAAETRTGLGLVCASLAGLKRPKVNGFRPDHAPRELVLGAWYKDASLAPHRTIRVDAPWVHGRGKNESLPALMNKKVAILGCGALGSHVATRLAQAGVGNLMLVDPQLLESANVGRHVLGIEDIGKWKADALARALRRRFPHLISAESLHRPWERLASEEWWRVTACDLIISTMGEWSGEGPLNEWHIGQDARPPIVYGWLEEFATASHALLISTPNSCLQCLLNRDGSTRVRETIWDDGAPLISEPVCGSSFQPFGPIELSYAEALVSDLAIDVLLGKRTENFLRSYATSLERLAGLRGMWSERHDARRPPGFRGHFIDEQAAPVEPACPVCKSDV